MASKNVENDVIRSGDSDLVAAVRRRVTELPGTPVVLKRLAHDLGVTPRQLTSAFERRMGVSVATYVRRERIRLAQRLLLQTSRSIQDIAGELGFSCAANFSSAFRRATGMSPTEFRDNPPGDVTLLTTSDVKWGR